MATKRMFSKDIVRTDKFLDMSLSTQALYFHLCLDADAKGFVNPRSIMRLINATVDELNILIAKKYVIPFESGVVVITDWRVHNYIDEKKEAKSQYVDEYHKLTLLEKGNYQLSEYSQSTLRVLSNSIDKSRVDKSSLDKNNIVCVEDFSSYLNKFNSLYSSKYQETRGRLDKYKLRLKTYSPEQIMFALENMYKIPFYQGKNERKWTPDPDYLIRNDENIDKMLNYKIGSKAFAGENTERFNNL